MSGFLFSAPRAPGVVAQLALALSWPARVLEARETLARLAELTERERQDIGGAHPDSIHVHIEESPADRQARLSAIRAWYGHQARAA